MMYFTPPSVRVSTRSPLSGATWMMTSGVLSCMRLLSTRLRGRERRVIAERLLKLTWNPASFSRRDARVFQHPNLRPETTSGSSDFVLVDLDALAQIGLHRLHDLHAALLAQRLAQQASKLPFCSSAGRGGVMWNSASMSSGDCRPRCGYNRGSYRDWSAARRTPGTGIPAPASLRHSPACGCGRLCLGFVAESPSGLDRADGADKSKGIDMVAVVQHCAVLRLERHVVFLVCE